MQFEVEERARCRLREKGKRASESEAGRRLISQVLFLIFRKVLERGRVERRYGIRSRNVREEK